MKIRLGDGLATLVRAAIPVVAGWDTERRTKECDAYADLIASGADAMWSDQRGEIDGEAVHGAIVHGLAVLAHRPEGVTFGGLHWHAGQCETCTGPGRWTLAEQETTRQARGAFFTPRTLAEEIVENTLAPAVARRDYVFPASVVEDCNVVDIACGSGAFLVAAARFLAKSLADILDGHHTCDDWLAWQDTDDLDDGALRYVIECCIYGVDIDPLSIELARLALQLLAPTWQPGQLTNLRVGDALIGRSSILYDVPMDFPETTRRFDWCTEFPHVFAAGGFTAVVGNPPFLGGQKTRGVLGRAYVAHLVKRIALGRTGSADLAAFFWLRAHELVADTGYVGIVATNTLLQGATGRVGYGLLRRRAWLPYRVDLSRPWPSRSAALAVCLIWTSRIASPGNRRTVDDNTLRALPYENPDHEHLPIYPGQD